MLIILAIYVITRKNILLKYLKNNILDGKLLGKLVFNASSTFQHQFIMGTLSSKYTRRISIDNTFAINPAVAIQKPFEDEAIMNVDELQSENNNEILFKDTNRSSDHEENRDYWVQRIDYLKHEHQLINKIIETEFEKTIHENNNLIETSNVAQDKMQKIKPCIDWRSKILQCYEANPHQPLVCSAVVQAFNNYVTSCRIEE